MYDGMHASAPYPFGQFTYIPTSRLRCEHHCSARARTRSEYNFRNARARIRDLLHTSHICIVYDVLYVGRYMYCAVRIYVVWLHIYKCREKNCMQFCCSAALLCGNQWLNLISQMIKHLNFDYFLIWSKAKKKNARLYQKIIIESHRRDCFE